MDALNADEVQSYLHAPEFGRRLHWVRFRSFAGTGASGQVAPIPAVAPDLSPNLQPGMSRVDWDRNDPLGACGASRFVVPIRSCSKDDPRSRPKRYPDAPIEMGG